MPPRHATDRTFLVGLGRAFGAAVMFALPMMMTMEMWSVGFVIEPVKLVSLMVVMVALAAGLSRFAGIREVSGWRESLVDGLVAVAVGGVMAVVLLALIGVLAPGMPAREMIGKAALQMFAGSVGAAIARDAMGRHGAGGGGPDVKHATHGAALFLMAAGAIFLGLNVAPTEEVVVIAYRIDAWQTVAVALASLALMHGFVYGFAFRGAPSWPEGARFASVFVAYTVVGYALALLVSLYLIWTFGRLSATGPQEVASAAIVLALPCSVGAAAFRLIL